MAISFLTRTRCGVVEKGLLPHPDLDYIVLQHFCPEPDVEKGLLPHPDLDYFVLAQNAICCSGKIISGSIDFEVGRDSDPR